MLGLVHAPVTEPDTHLIHSHHVRTSFPEIDTTVTCPMFGVAANLTGIVLGTGIWVTTSRRSQT